MNFDSYENENEIQNEYIGYTATPATTKKKGRPGYQKEENRKWTDEETFILIEIWSGYENLYNTKDNDYHNRDKRQKCLLAIEKALSENNITANVKEITKKLTDLKNCYGGQKRLVEGVRSGDGADAVFVSKWKFYTRLEFLKDSL